MLNKMKYIDQADSFDIIIPAGETVFVHDFPDGYIEYHKVAVEGIPKGKLESIDVQLDKVTITVTDTAGYTGSACVYGSDNNTNTLLKVYKHIKKSENFLNTNYDKLGLKKEKVFTNGQLSVVNYWGAYDKPTKTFSDLVVREDVVYNRDTNNYVETRDKTHTWINNDDTDGKTKKTTKVYSPTDAVAEGVRLRSNKIDSLKINTIGLIAQTTPCDIATAEGLGMPFIIAADSVISSYKMGATQPLLDFIANADVATYVWLDNDIGGGTTIRMYMISILA